MKKFMRSPYQILAIPYRKTSSLQFAVFHRSDCDCYQFVAGGGENDENPIDTAKREIFEETSVRVQNIMQLQSIAYVPIDIVWPEFRKHWPKDMYVIPEYAFAYECQSSIKLSGEHTEFVWLEYDAAIACLSWDSNKTALFELNRRLLCDIK